MKKILYVVLGLSLSNCTPMLDTYKEAIDIAEPRHEQLGISTCIVELYKETRRQSDKTDLIELLTICGHIYKGSADSQRILMEKLVNEQSSKDSRKITIPTKREQR